MSGLCEVNGMKRIFTGVYDITLWKDLPLEEQVGFASEHNCPSSEHAKEIWKGRAIYVRDIVEIRWVKGKIAFKKKILR